jgi:small GTP-binding protein
MPANLPPQYYETEKKLKEAKTPQEKIKIYEELYAIMPKHKGTDKLQADIKRRIAKLREQMLEKKTHGKRQNIYYIEKEGAGQIVIIGPPNSGKSTLLSKLTNATPKISDYPFTTVAPLAGMMKYEDIWIQLIDTPPLREEMPGWQYDIIRRGDAVAFLFDISEEDVLEKIENSRKILEDGKLKLVDYRKETENNISKKAIFVGNKIEKEKAEENEKILRELYGENYEIICVSLLEEKNLEILKEKFFKLLGIIRVYTKQPGEKPDLETPFTIKAGSNLLELAELIHKDFALNLKYARVWGEGKYNGQKVQKDYLLQDKDIIEFHI